jgi:hypothetical protein
VVFIAGAVNIRPVILAAVAPVILIETCAERVGSRFTIEI